MAQTHAVPADFLPPVRRENAVTITPTMPTMTDRFRSRPAETGTTGATAVSSSPAPAMVEESVYLPEYREPGRAARFLTSCVAVAGRAGRLAVRYRAELMPAGAVGALTGLGWWQHLAGAGGAAGFGYSALAILSAAVAGVGLERQHPKVLAAGAGLAVAFVDVAAGTAAGPGAVSITASAVTAGLAYSAYVPWLVKHRKEQKQVSAKNAPAGSPVVVNELPVDAGVSVVAPMEAQVESVDGQMFAAPAVLAPAMPSAVGPAQAAARSPFHDDVIAYSDEDTDDITQPIRIGWDENGRPVHLTLLYRHTLVAGASDFGKSGIVNLIIKKLLKKRTENRELFGIDMKPGAPELGPWAPKFRRLATTPEEARDLLQYIRAECDRRGQFLSDLSAREMAAGRGPVRKWIPGVHGPAWWVITDELAELIRQDEELRKQEAELRKLDPESSGPAEQEIAVTYESLLAIARFLGIQFVSATQQPSAKVFGGNTDARGNYANRISTRVGEAGHSAFIFGSGCAGKGWRPEELTRPGEFLFGAPEMPLVKPPKCRAEYVTDLDIAADVAHLHTARTVEPIGRFAPQGNRALHLVSKPVKPAGPTYPDGTVVPRDEWPDLYRVFCKLCDKQGYATKEDLVEHGPFASRDTARRALDEWAKHGVLVRKEGRTEQFYRPNDSKEGTA